MTERSDKSLGSVGIFRYCKPYKLSCCKKKFQSISSAIAFFILTIILSVNASALYSLNDLFQVVETGENFTEIRFKLTGYEQQDYDINGVTYTRFYHPEAGIIMNKGYPEVLTFSTLISIPNTGTVTIDSPDLINQYSIKGIDLMPSQGYDPDIDGKDIAMDHTFYTKDIEYPFSLFKVSEPAVLRDVRLVNVTVKPFMYNPQKKELSIIEEMVIRIHYNTQERGKNEIRRETRSLSRSFEPLYEGSVLNYEQFSDRSSGYQNRSILIVRHHNQAITNLVDQFVEWKRDKGFIVRSIDTADYSTATAIRDYIRNVYYNETDPPEYVVIIGGGSGALEVPYWFAHHGPGDHPYTLMDDNDNLPDLFIGRISVESAYELATVWNKIRTYERTPFIDNEFNWHQNQLLVGDPRVSGISTINTNKYIKEIMSRRFDNYTFAEIYDGNFPNRINAELDRGAGFFSFRGLELMGGWVPTNEADYNNGARTPNATLITCNTLDFNGGKQVEPFFRTGTPTTPRGAVSGIGMTTNYTLTSFNSCLAGGIYYGLFVDDLRTMGEALVSGKLYLWRVFGNLHSSQPPQYFHWANLIGDPSMDVWKQQPQPMTVSYQAELPPGSNSINVVVTDSDEMPLENAWVTVRTADNEFFTTGYTDNTGEINLFFSDIPRGSVRLTATKPDFIPHLGGFSIQGSPALSFYELDLEEDMTPGEQLAFNIRIKNHSDQIRESITAVISTEDQYMEIISGNAAYPDVNANDIVTNISPYLINVAHDVPDKHSTLFTMSISNGEEEWISRFDLLFFNGKLTLAEILVNGDAEVNLDPDQTGNVSFKLKNDGSFPLTDIYVTIESESQKLSVIDNDIFFGEIPVGETVVNSQDYFRVYADSTIIPGMVFELQLKIYNEQGFAQTLGFDLPVGNVTVTDPFGPDAYGYWCYDEGDTGYIDVPVYDWIEISPSEGGDGINTGLESDYMNNQQVTYADLPFAFRFYGVEYQQISICSNGWISFGITEQSTHKNWRLPGALGPYAMVAAFWENLSLREGGVYTYFNEDENIYIIQWHNALNIMQDAPQTFQIILYDPEHYPTITGDGGIKIQYKVFNNINNGAYMPSGTGNWGNYATVGIADHTCTIGLEYTFNDRYPLTAKPLTDESAIYFTSGYGTPLRTDQEENPNLPSEAKLYDAYPNPFNPSTNITFYIHQSAQVALEIFDIKGRRVTYLVNEFLETGEHNYIWQGRDDFGKSVSSGIYFFRLLLNNDTGKSQASTKKMLLLK